MNPETQSSVEAIAAKLTITSRRTNLYFPYKTDWPDDLSDCRVDRMAPWRLVIWEPLHTTAPGPSRAYPFCCYVKTVIFYHRDGLEEHDRIETRLSWEDVVEYDCDLFSIGGGAIQWLDGRWWMERNARRLDDRQINRFEALQKAQTP